MAFQSVKRSWRNVAATPPKPVVLLHVEPPPPSPYTAFEDFMFHCISDQAPIGSNWEQRRLNLFRDQIAAYMVGMFENQSLSEMQNKKNPGFLKLQSDLQWVANEIKCNIFVFLGHIEQCSDYILQSKQKMFKYLEDHPTYQNTIFLIIGCFGGVNAHTYNTNVQFKDFHDRKIAFFGFKDLMHFHAGEIYSCKEFSHMIQRLFCNYEGI